MTIERSVPSVYARLGVRPVIHASGTTTRYGGSRMRPETIEAMREAAQALVNIDELNEAAGAAIAWMLGAEAALVTAGSAAGLVLQAAACIAGDDPARIARLPDVTGMRHEFVIQRAHRFSYDQSFRVPGGELVEIGLGRRTMPYELENAIGPRTAGVVYLVSPFTSRRGSFRSRKCAGSPTRVACRWSSMWRRWSRPARISSATSATAPIWWS
jgi:L-seryl-tRNA(Ser) seleniumtransferase